MAKGISTLLLATLTVTSIEVSVGQDAESEDAQAFLEVSSREALNVVTDPASDHAAVADYLWRLRSFAGSGQLTPETITRIRDAARQRLTGEQHYAVVTRAIDLAAMVGDSSTLERIASNAAEVRTLGFSEPGMIERIQQLARENLDGVSLR